MAVQKESQEAYAGVIFVETIEYDGAGHRGESGYKIVRYLILKTEKHHSCITDAAILISFKLGKFINRPFKINPCQDR